MARGLFTIISVVPLGGIPSRYRLTVSSTAGLATGDHIGARLSGGTSVIYLVDNLLGGTVIEVIDSLTEAEPGEFGLPAPGQAGFSTPEPSKDLTQLPFNSPGWDAATRRNNKIMDGFVGGGGGGGATGPTGPPGPAGPAGADGMDGTNGTNGVNGNDGADGNDGAAGMDGTNGIDGNDGMDGAAGAPGVDGAVGPQGPQGPQGDASDVTLSEVLANGNTTSSGTFDNGGIIVSMGDEISGELDLLLRASQDLFLVSDAGDIIFTARGASTPFNEVGQESLSTTAFGSMSIIGALNELVGIASAGVGSLSQTLNVGNTTGMSDIIFSDGGFNLLWGTDGSGDIGSGPTSLDNRPSNVWVKDQLQVGDSTVVLTSGGDVTASGTGYFGTSLNVGNGVTPSTTNGDIRAGNGTSALTWANANGGALAVTGSGNVRAFQVNTDRNAANICGLLNSNAGASAQAAWRAECDGTIAQMSAHGGGNYSILDTSGTGSWRIRTTAIGQHIYFQTGGASNTLRRWYIDGTNALLDGTSGHLLAFTDNTYDIGAGGATRPRTGYFGTALNVGNGITPSTANGDIVAGDGTRSMVYDASNSTLTVAAVGNDFSTIDVNTGLGALALCGVNLTTDVGGTARGGSLQAFSSTWAASGGYDIASSFAINSSLNATGGLVLSTFGNAPIRFFTNGTSGAERWQITATGHLIGFADNTYDIGASGVTRPRTAYVGTSIITPLLENTGALADLTLGARGSTITLNELGQESLETTSFAATSIIGALNELVGLVEASGTLAETLVLGNTTGGNHVLFSDDDDLLWATDGGGNIGSGPTSLDNRPSNVWVKDQLQVGDNTVTLTSGGDISAGDGTSEFQWIASDGRIRLLQDNAVTGKLWDNGAVSMFLASNTSGAILLQRHSNDSNGPTVAFRKARGTLGAALDISADDQIGSVRAQVYTGISGSFFSMATIGIHAATTPLFNSAPGYFTFSTNDVLETNPTERWRITPPGHFITGAAGINIGSTTTAEKPSIVYAAGNVFAGTAVEGSLNSTTGSGARLGASGSISSIREDAGTADSVSSFSCYRKSTGTPAANFGSDFTTFLEGVNVPGANTAGVIRTQWDGNPATPGFSSKMSFWVHKPGAGAGSGSTNVLTMFGSNGRSEFNGGVEIGSTVVGTAADGDIIAGNGTHGLFYDTSVGALGISVDASVGLHAGRSIHVQSDGTVCRVFELETSTNVAATASVLFGSRSRGIPGTPAQVQDGDLLFAFNAAGYLAGTINNHRTMAGIRFYADGLINESTVEQARISFETVTGITNAERWTIRHDGHLTTGPADNTYDIGAAGVTRPRTGYFGTSLVVGDTITIDSDSIKASGELSIDADGTNSVLNLGVNTTQEINIGADTTFVAGITIDFTETIVIGLSLGTPRQEELTTENIINTDVVLIDVLSFTPVNENPTNGLYESVVLFLNGVLRRQGIGLDYTVAEGTSGIEITWLANSGTAVDMDTSDVLTAVYSSSD